MNILLNGQDFPVPDGTTSASLVHMRRQSGHLRSPAYAVKRNKDVVIRAPHEAVRLPPGGPNRNRHHGRRCMMAAPAPSALNDSPIATGDFARIPPLAIGPYTRASRLIVGTGKYSSLGRVVLLFFVGLRLLRVFVVASFALDGRFSYDSASSFPTDPLLLSCLRGKCA